MTVFASNYFRSKRSKPAQVRCEMINMDHCMDRIVPITDSASPHGGAVSVVAQLSKQQLLAAKLATLIRRLEEDRKGHNNKCNVWVTISIKFTDSE